MDKNSLIMDKKQNLIVILDYLVGYVFIYPLIVSWLYSIGVFSKDSIVGEVIIYVLVFWVTVAICRKNLFNGLTKKYNYLKIIWYTIVVVLVQLVMMVVLTLLFDIDTSANQQSIIESLATRPIYTKIIVLIFGPVVEELVFRECIYKQLDYSGKKNFGRRLSAFLFGFVHVFSSLLQGNFSDLIYLFVYMAIGYVLTMVYDSTDSIVACILVHMLNNFLGLL